MGNNIQQGISFDGILRVADAVPHAVGPGRVFFDDPGHLSCRRVSQTIGKRLRAGTLLFGVASLMLLVVHCGGERGLFGGVGATHGVLIRHYHR